jgi:hypothetical protein
MSTFDQQRGISIIPLFAITTPQIRGSHDAFRLFGAFATIYQVFRIFQLLLKMAQFFDVLAGVPGLRLGGGDSRE